MNALVETQLPGVGIRHDFTTGRGDRIGVLNRLGGERELLLYDRNDPDACSTTVRLEESESEVLAQLLGVTQITQNLDAVREAVGGLMVERLPIEAGSTFAGRTISDTQMRTRTGVSIVAVLHQEGAATPSPGPEQTLEPGDTLLVVGTAEGVQAADLRLRGER
ncbi:cation:proton antiporter regulatory subunit [Paraconexibacter sp.]|uniref:cation:proton antiporter regulatory subunit n=1 Tax=Paraconexibacter sp. TaxID=2949640 RepID=UPI003569027C